MGQMVPTMVRPRIYGTRAVAGGMLALGRRAMGPCTQCGAPDETGAHVCAYCLSPRQPDVHAQNNEQFKRNHAAIEAQQRYNQFVRARANPIAQTEPDRR